MSDVLLHAARRRVRRFALVAVVVVMAAWAVFGPPTFAAQPTVDAQLEIVSIVDTPDPVAPGAPLTYAIVATNLGPSGIFEGVVTVDLAPHVTFVAGSGTATTPGLEPPVEFTCTAASQVECRVGLMAAPPANPGEPGPTTVTIEIEVLVRSAAEVANLPPVMTTVVAIDGDDAGVTIEGERDNENTTLATPTTTPPTTPPPPRAAVTLTADADGDGVFAEQEGPVRSGASVRYRARVANAGQAPFPLEDLSDTLGGLPSAAGCLAPIPPTIPVGATVVCDFDATVTGAPGSVVTNQVTATASDGSAFSDAAFVSIQTAVPPRIAVTATAEPAVVQAPGGQVTYRVEVRNLTSQPVDLVELTDTRRGSLAGAGDCRVPAAVAGGGRYSCSYGAEVSGAAGSTAVNVVTAVARDAAGEEARDDDGADVVIIAGPGPQPGQLAVTVAAAAAPPEGATTVQWRVTIANNGTAPVTLATLAADRSSTIGTCATGVLIDRVPRTCRFSSAVPRGNAGDRESITVTATGTGGGSASGSGTAEFTNRQPSLSVDVAAAESVVLGDDLAVGLRVTNTSPAPTDPVDVVSISLQGADRTSECTIGRLEPGATSPECTLLLPVDAPRGATVPVAVVVRGDDDEGTLATASGQDSATVRGADDFRLDMVLIDAELDSLEEPRNIVGAGTRFRYVVVVVNRDTGPASLPAVTVELPPQVTTTGLCDLNGPGETVSLIVEGEVPPRGREIADVVVELCPGPPATAVARASVAGLEDEETTPVFGGAWTADRLPPVRPAVPGSEPPGAEAPEVESETLQRVAGTVFLDSDGDGEHDDHAAVDGLGEPGLAGVIVELAAGGGVLQAPTDRNGGYAFPDPVAGTAEVRVVLDSVPDGLEPTTATTQRVGARATIDFGFWQEGSQPLDAPERPSNLAAWGAVALGLGAVGAAETAFGLHSTGRLPGRRRP